MRVNCPDLSRARPSSLLLSTPKSFETLPAMRNIFYILPVPIARPSWILTSWLCRSRRALPRKTWLFLARSNRIQPITMMAAKYDELEVWER